MLPALQTYLGFPPAAAVVGGGEGVVVVVEVCYAAEHCHPAAEEAGEGVGGVEAAAASRHSSCRVSRRDSLLCLLLHLLAVSSLYK
jgi:hypothetical protein